LTQLLQDRLDFGVHITSLRDMSAPQIHRPLRRWRDATHFMRLNQ
jgi:hypothetical protein